MNEGIKEALEYAVELAKPNIFEHEDYKFSDKKLYRVHEFAPTAEPLELNTLTSLVDYIRSNTDKMPDNMILHIKSPTNVVLLSSLDMDRRRETLVDVNALIPKFSFGNYYDKESFIINIMANFVDGVDEINDKDAVLKFAGTVESGTVASYGDDGVSQKATVQKTLTSKEDSIIPNPVRLKPYRTFLEVEQPASDFIFRMKDGNGMSGGVHCALFEADGGAWKSVAKDRIKEFLSSSLGEDCELNGVKFTIIS